MLSAKPFLFFVLYSFSLALCATSGFAQHKPAVISGLVKDENGMPLDHATIILVQLPDSTAITSTYTTADGRFILHAPKNKMLVYRIAAMGFRSFQSTGFKLLKDTVIAVPHVLVQLSKGLSEVKIEAAPPALMQSKGNKLIYNVAASINATGSNVLDVIKKTPGVMVERDNSIGINGRKGVLVLINGKRSYLQDAELADFLKSMPAFNVKSIEVMNNASAQYDAAGSGGVINIVLNKPAADGFNINLNNGLSYGFSTKQNTELSFNSRSGKLNVFGTYNHVLGNYGFRYGMTRIQDNKIFESPTVDTDHRKTIGSMLAADYQISAHHTIGAALNGNFLFGPGITDTRTSIRDLSSGQLLSTLIASNDYYQQNASRYNSNLNYRFQNESGQRFNFDIDYGFFDGGSKNLQPNQYFDANGNTTSATVYRSLNSRNIKLFAISSGYETNLGKAKLNSGLKFSSVAADNRFTTAILANGQETLDLKRSNQFNYKEYISAAYTQYSVPLTEKLKFEAGVRLEQTHAEGDLVPIDPAQQQAEQIKRNYLNLFPSASLNWEIRENQSLSFSYGKRIDRPSYQSLNPFEYLLDELSFWKGNPFLQPQITHKIEAVYAYHKTIISVSHSMTNDYAAQITDTLDINKVVMIPKNLGKQFNTGLTLNQQLSPVKGWDISLSATGYYLRNKVAFDEARNFDIKRFAGIINVQQRFSLPFELTGEIGAVYYTRRPGGSNDIMKVSSQIDAGIQRKLFSNKASLKLAVTDIFWGNNWNSTSEMNGLYLKAYGRGETRQVRLNFSFNLGKTGIKDPSKRSSGLQSETQRL